MKRLRIGVFAAIAVLGGLGAQRSSAGGTCDQPYFPVRAGATWTYSTILKSGKPSQHTITIENLTDSSFTQHQVFGAGTGKNAVDVQTNWSCSASGLTSSQTNNNTVSTSSMQVNAKVIRQSGVVIPANMGVGSSWTFSQTSSMKMGNRRLELPTEATFKVVGQERVTVAAGSFTALKVSSVSKITIPGTSKMNSLNTTSWYARGVGMVKTVSDAGTTTELVSYRI